MVVAPSRKRPKMSPMNQGSGSSTVFSADQPATFRSSPRGMATVRLASMPSRFVLSGGAE